MFKGQNIFQIINSGGFTMYLLILCSIISIAVIVERIIYYQRRCRTSRAQLMEGIRKDAAKGQLANATGICRNDDSPCAKVALAGLNLNGHDERVITNAMEREIIIETIKMERFTSIIGTLGGTAVYIGLFGTVLGIMRAFSDIARAGSGGMDIVTQGIAEALVCTAAGLLVAIPAVISYNFFIRTIDNIVMDMELTASEVVDLLGIGKK